MTKYVSIRLFEGGGDLLLRRLAQVLISANWHRTIGQLQPLLIDRRPKTRIHGATMWFRREHHRLAVRFSGAANCCPLCRVGARGVDKNHGAFVEKVMASALLTKGAAQRYVVCGVVRQSKEISSFAVENMRLADRNTCAGSPTTHHAVRTERAKRLADIVGDLAAAVSAACRGGFVPVAFSSCGYPGQIAKVDAREVLALACGAKLGKSGTSLLPLHCRRLHRLVGDLLLLRDVGDGLSKLHFLGMPSR